MVTHFSAGEPVDVLDINYGIFPYNWKAVIRVFQYSSESLGLGIWVRHCIHPVHAEILSTHDIPTAFVSCTETEIAVGYSCVFCSKSHQDGVEGYTVSGSAFYEICGSGK